MKQPKKIALLSMGAGLVALGIWATTAARAATTSSDVDRPLTTTSAATATTDTNTSTIAPSTAWMGHHQQRLADMAAVLGITTDQLQTELQSGKEFYQIAAGHGVTYDKLKANAESKFKARLDDMVKVGFLTKDEASTMLKQSQDNAAQTPMLGMISLGRGFHGHGFGF